MITVFGIRHHGPGSAKSMLKAIQALEPDILLVEGPADAQAMIPFIGNPKLKPPVSILLYNPKNFDQAVYLPFAEFSPEWQAIKYGLKANIPIEFMDLPYSTQFALDEQNQTDLELPFQPKPKKKKKRGIKDPLGFMAKLAGYTDSERWWEVTFEQHENQQEIFDAILEMMTALRQDAAANGKENGADDIEELRREAYMRKCIRNAEKKGFQNIAIVCGAWHAPVLTDMNRFKASRDNAILKGMKKVNTKSTWVPWTYDRLAFQSGYGAGVTSPAWYDLLFSNRKNATIRWMTKAARLFRKEDMDASAAHIIEAVRLANTLATLRGLPIPGIEEMKESAVSIYCEGYEEQLSIVIDKLIIGDVIGKVPPEIPLVPIQADLEKTIKSCRLSKYKDTTEDVWLKANATNKRGGIDLREEKDLMKSHLLHRLNILQIRWGRQMKGSQFDTGSFKEYWKLKWRPDFAIKIIEAGMWGNTVKEAATSFVIKSTHDLSTLPELTQLVERVINADLPEAMGLLITKLQNIAAITKDVQHLMDAIPPLVNAVRYGSTRQVNIPALQMLIDQMIPRVCIGLPGACSSLNESAAESMFEKLVATNRAINLMSNPEHQVQWFNCLSITAESSLVNGILKGACSRILFDQSLLSKEEMISKMHFSLSVGNKRIDAAFWLQGFLHGSALLLIHNPALWNILDGWIQQMDWLDFKETLPLLRRTFADFSAPERQKMMELVKHKNLNPTVTKPAALLVENTRTKKIEPTLRMLLGLDS